MAKKKKLGIWMCQSVMHLMEYNIEEPIDMDTIPCMDTITTNTSLPIIEFSEVQKAEIFRKQEEFKKIAAKIIAYDQIVLFGPMDVKKEFQIYLETNHALVLPEIEVKQTEIMTEAQQIAFVKHHFLHHNSLNN
jgi:hypothetical protein